MSAVKQFTYRIKLQTVTPVSIGSDKGDSLSPYADYVFSDDGKQLLYLRQPTVEAAVMQAGALDDYIAGIRESMDNNRSAFDLKQFLTGRLKGNLPDLVLQTVEQHGMQAGQRVPVSPMVKNAGQLFIPGSSIKGALRTAMLYDWLVNTADGLQNLKESAKQTETCLDIREQIFKLKKGPDRYEQYVKRQIRELEQKARSSERSIFEEEKLFGGLREGPDARFIRVSDTAALRQPWEVHALRRIRIVPGQGKSSIPQVLEAIPPGTSFEFEVSALEGFRHQALHYWLSGSFETVFKNLNTFSKACIENEIFELEDALDSTEPLAFEREVNQLLGFYRGLLEKVDAGHVFLRLGFGKTVSDNSLILALLNGLETSDAWHSFRAAFHKIRRRDAFFPVTRALTHQGKPMGWVELKSF